MHDRVGAGNELGEDDYVGGEVEDVDGDGQPRCRAPARRSHLTTTRGCQMRHDPPAEVAAGTGDHDTARIAHGPPAR